MTTCITILFIPYMPVPTVTFTQSQYYVEEPLSNFPVDKKCVMLTLSRSGDSEKQVSVVLSTRPGTAHEGVDYTALNTVLQIPAGVNRVNTTVLVLANHNSQQDSTFTAFLSVNATIGTEVRLGRRRKARITIRQTVLKGVYFPALPLVGSQQYPSSGGTTSNLTFGVLLFYDNPLLCVTVSPLSMLWCTCVYPYVHNEIPFFYQLAM